MHKKVYKFSKIVYNSDEFKSISVDRSGKHSKDVHDKELFHTTDR